MEENTVINSETLGKVSNSKGGLIAKIAVGALGAAAAVAGVIFLRKRKHNNETFDVEVVEPESNNEE